MSAIQSVIRADFVEVLGQFATILENLETITKEHEIVAARAKRLRRELHDTIQECRLPSRELLEAIEEVGSFTDMDSEEPLMVAHSRTSMRASMLLGESVVEVDSGDILRPDQIRRDFKSFRIA